MKSKYLLVGALLLLLALALAACSTPTPAPTQAPEKQCPPAPTAAPCPSCPTCPTPEKPPEPVVKVVPYQDEWANSPHNDVKAEPFNHWNADNPAVVPAACATCHSTPGYVEFVTTGATKDQEIGTTVTCVACHNAGTATLTSVKFPSGAEITGLGPEARCMVCHQGRSSKVNVDKKLAQFGADKELDKVPAAQGDATLGFENIHYFAAAATLYGTQVQGGYEYEGKSYEVKNEHQPGYNTCVGCHNQHTLKVKVEQCSGCHKDVKSEEDLKKIRMANSAVDYNGNGDTTEGIASEIEGLQSMLLTAIQSYGKEVASSAIAYNAAAYPYFYADDNGNGQVDEGEKAYAAWTGRLLKAAYNYQVSIKDPGAFAHNPKYIIELLYDSIEDLNTKISTPVDLSKAHRISAGHFAGSEAPWRHWDAPAAEGAPGMLVAAGCAKCHSATGLPQFLKEGVNITNPASDGLHCSTCHADLATFARYQVKDVKFPSGKVVSFGENADANLCIECHQGRESKVSVDASIKASGAKDDEVSDKLTFRNPHYFAAGANLFGTEAMGGYEYDGQKYAGRNMHTQGMDTCVACHDKHGLNVQIDKCATCHPAVKTPEDVTKIRMTTVDYNGNGDTTEGIASEVKSLSEKVMAAMQAYTVKQKLPGIVYSPASYPYFFADTNGNGQLDADEAVSSNAYKSWTPRLLRAAYNYQWVIKDPGAFAHNSKYVLQLLYDSLKDLGGDVKGLTRP